MTPLSSSLGPPDESPIIIWFAIRSQKPPVKKNFERCRRLTYSESKAEGFVRLNKEFEAQPPIIQADVLKDWIYELEQLYAERLKDGLA